MSNFCRDDAISIDANRRARVANSNKLTLSQSTKIFRVCCVSIDENVFEMRVFTTTAIEDTMRSIVVMR